MKELAFRFLYVSVLCLVQVSPLRDIQIVASQHQMSDPGSWEIPQGKKHLFRRHLGRQSAGLSSWWQPFGISEETAFWISTLTVLPISLSKSSWWPCYTVERLWDLEPDTPGFDSIPAGFCLRDRGHVISHFWTPASPCVKWDTSQGCCKEGSDKTLSCDCPGHREGLTRWGAVIEYGSFIPL